MLKQVKVSESLLRGLTLIFLVLTLLVGAVYLIIFINPYVPLNPFPPSPQPEIALQPTPAEVPLVITFPPTWTPTPTSTPTSTP
ncbi:MAG TPA: hypothetical protein ENG33_07300, partial [Chloroflexi bacterium]|nr:hypothetical protein [Chloroflexota bacterium]